MLLAAEWGNHSLESTSGELAACLDTVIGRFWGDLLPWRLALESCRHNPRGVSGLDELIANLDHHNSCTRLWMFDLAWCVRDRLNPVEATVRLLKDVADTIAYWDSALGLCRSLIPAGEAFWAMADHFQPKSFAEQYQDRMNLARKEGLSMFERRFELLELRLRRLIGQSALGLTPEEINIVNDAKPFPAEVAVFDLAELGSRSRSNTMTTRHWRSQTKNPDRATPRKKLQQPTKRRTQGDSDLWMRS